MTVHLYPSMGIHVDHDTAAVLFYYDTKRGPVYSVSLGHVTTTPDTSGGHSTIHLTLPDGTTISDWHWGAFEEKLARHVLEKVGYDLFGTGVERNKRLSLG